MKKPKRSKILEKKKFQFFLGKVAWPGRVQGKFCNYRIQLPHILSALRASWENSLKVSFLSNIAKCSPV